MKNNFLFRVITICLLACFVILFQLGCCSWESINPNTLRAIYFVICTIIGFTMLYQINAYWKD